MNVRSAPQRPFLRSALYVLLLAVLVLDLSYSFLQYLHQPLDGDMAWNVVPDHEVQQILDDPLGIGPITEGYSYPNPNRFFCHWIFRAYLAEVPLLLQGDLGPIDSVYLACAIAKLMVHVLLLLLIAAYATGSLDVRRLDFVAAAALVTPLFQANGYRSYMGIIDPSTTYTFFYALPCAVLLLYFLPWFLRWMNNDREERPAGRAWWWTIPLSFVVCLSGPLDPGAVLVAALLLVSGSVVRAHRHGARGVGRMLAALPRSYWPYLLPAVLLSLYSLYLGRYNSITIHTHIPLAERFAQLPMGVYYQFTQKLGFPVLFAIIAINLGWIARTDRSEAARRIRTMAKWIGAFAVLYILLLPFGGYRDYRPYVLRYDTIMPITLALFFLFAISSLHILRSLTKGRWWYPVLLVGVGLIFTVADGPEFEQDRCEREALATIAASNEAVVALDQACSVLDWRPIHDPQASALNAQLLLKWRIIDRPKLYYNRPLE